MRITVTRHVAIGAFTLAMLVSAAVDAQTTSVPIAITCTSSGQLCTPAFTVPVTTGGLLQVQSPEACQDARADR